MNAVGISMIFSANCSGKSVRLVSDSQRSAGGLVEICVGERVSLWAGVCHENFTLAAATVICRQLGLLQNASSGMLCYHADMIILLINCACTHNKKM